MSIPGCACSFLSIFLWWLAGAWDCGHVLMWTRLRAAWTGTPSLRTRRTVDARGHPVLWWVLLCTSFLALAVHCLTYDLYARRFGSWLCSHLQVIGCHYTEWCFHYLFSVLNARYIPTHDVSGFGSTPVFMWLAVTILIIYFFNINREIIHIYDVSGVGSIPVFRSWFCFTNNSILLLI
jgi:hypothetical protein